ncbi:MAG TPA: EAL domain-containing protein [Acidimicrobiia bacterium]|nr:EAL domain-containing protein [Acidimicrobiia bacterium]
MGDEGSRRDTRRLRIWLLTAAMAAVGALAIAFAGTFDPIPGRPLDAPWWAIAVGFAVAELLVIHLHVRSDAHSISLSEIPFAFGLALGSPLALVVGRLVGSGAILVVHRRQQPTKLAFNVALMALETGTGILVFRSVLGSFSPVEPLGWVALFLGLSATLTMGVGAVTVALALNDRTRGIWEVARSMGAGVFIGTVTSLMAIVAVTVVWSEPWGAVPVTVIGGLAAIAVRVYRSLSERYEDLEAVYAFGHAIENAASPDDRIGSALHHVRDLMRADVAELAVGETACRVVVGEPGVALLDDPGAVPHPGRVPRGLLRVRAEDLRHFGRPVDQAVVVPVPTTDGEDGCLVVAAPLTTSRGYDADDVRLLEILARQLGQTLEHERLVARLRDELASREHRATHDALTGLPNRQWFVDAVQDLLAADERFAVALVDLDRFREVNDTLGHQHGDQLIAEVADRIGAALLDGEVVARFGSDEFGLVLRPEDGVVGALDRARSVREALSAPFESEGFTFEVLASIGIALAPEDGSEPQTLVRRADVAMHEAKRVGSGYEVYDSQRDRYSTRRLVVAGELRTAIVEGLVEVHYQPKLAVSDLRVVGVEALARWTHDRLGPVRPDEFVAVAEQTGLIAPLTELVLRTALEDLAKLHADGHDFGMAVNVAARSLSDPGLPTLVAAIVEDTGVDPRLLTLEVTETMVMNESPRTSAVLSALDEIGVRLSIDDFGTGYSSLAYLTRLPVDEVKIDRAFVGNMAVEHRHGKIVRSTTDMAHALDLEVVAEGVENRATLELLRAARADVAQGYYFARPMPRDALVEWLADGGATGLG